MSVTFNLDENEQTDWYMCDVFGEYETQQEAEFVAARLACEFHDFVEFYCETHDSDGVAFHVIDRVANMAVTAYDLYANGEVMEWHDECMNGWKVI